MILLKNDPVLVPSNVIVFRIIVGFGAVFQTTPRAVIGEPPSSRTFPPLVAVVFWIDVTVLDVETVGDTIDGSVVKVTSFP